jgi:hypothetical protein
MRLRRGETVSALLPRTDSAFALRNCDHLRRPHCALGRSALPYSQAADSLTGPLDCARFPLRPRHAKVNSVNHIAFKLSVEISNCMSDCSKHSANAFRIALRETVLSRELSTLLRKKRDDFNI